MRQNKQSTERSRSLRRNATPAERILWSQLRGRRFAGLKFRRQVPFGPYILDIYCAAACVVVELDGESHLGKEQRDGEREAWLRAQGLKVLRFWNTDLYEEREAVMETI